MCNLWCRKRAERHKKMEQRYSRQVGHSWKQAKPEPPAAVITPRFKRLLSTGTNRWLKAVPKCYVKILPHLTKKSKRPLLHQAISRNIFYFATWYRFSCFLKDPSADYPGFTLINFYNCCCCCGCCCCRGWNFRQGAFSTQTSQPVSAYCRNWKSRSTSAYQMKARRGAPFCRFYLTAKLLQETKWRICCFRLFEGGIKKRERK